MNARGPARERLVTGIVGGVLVAAVVAGATLIYVGQGGYVRPGASVILISIDTLRADHLGCYGYPRDTSPAVDRFARDALLFELPIAQAPSTEPSHASIFTSLLPEHHGAYFSFKAALPDEMTTMAEILSERGYDTKSFNDGAQVAAQWGFDQGFDEYTTLPGPATSYKFRRTVEHAVAWLERRDDRPFFLFLHTYEPHHPYVAESRYYELLGHENSSGLPAAVSKQLLERLNQRFASISDSEREHVIAAYDAEIRSMDEAFAELRAALERLGLYDEVLLVFTSDHGEELGEREKIGWHSHALYDEQIHVPLILRLPDGRLRGRRVPDQVRSIDILPTVLDVLGVPPLEAFEGQSLMPHARGRARGHLPAVSQRDVVRTPRPRSLRTGEWKYYERSQIRQRFLFDLVADPGERRDLEREERARMRRLRLELDRLIEARPRAIYVGDVELDPELKARLEDLGYIR